MAIALDHFDRQMVVIQYVLQKVLQLAMPDALIVRAHNICDSRILMLKYCESFDNYSKTDDSVCGGSKIIPCACCC